VGLGLGDVRAYGGQTVPPRTPWSGGGARPGFRFYFPGRKRCARFSRLGFAIIRPWYEILSRNMIIRVLPWDEIIAPRRSIDDWR